MASYNTVPAEDTRLQEAPKSWKLKKIVVVSAALSFSLGACAATALSYREVGASRATQLVAQTDCQAKYPNLCSDDGCNCRCPPLRARASKHRDQNGFYSDAITPLPPKETSRIRAGPRSPRP